jgi:hypothetical protein
MRTYECLVCNDDSEHTDLLWAPCSRHLVCDADLNDWFTRATTDESMFPPKCCGAVFTLDEYREYLDKGVLGAYEAKAGAEFCVPAK